MKNWKNNLNSTLRTLPGFGKKELLNLSQEEWEKKFKFQWVIHAARKDHNQCWEMFKLRWEKEGLINGRSDRELLLDYQNLLLKLKLLEAPALSATQLAQGPQLAAGPKLATLD